MISFFAGLLLASVGWFVYYNWNNGTGDSGLIDYNNKLYKKDWNGLKGYLKDKCWNLSVETEEWRKRINFLRKKKSKNKKEAEEEKKEMGERYYLTKFQEAKIIFITATLENFFNEKEFKEKVFSFKKWKISKDGNRIIKK